MSDLVITCPACASAIPLTEQLAGPLVADMRARFEAQAERDRKAAEAAVAAARREAAEALDRERARLAAEAKAAAERAQAEEVARLRARAEAQAAEQAKALAEVQARAEEQAAALRAAEEAREEARRAAAAAAAEALRKERAIAEREAALDLAVQKQVTETLAAERAALRAQSEEALAQRLKAAEEAQAQRLAEKDEQMAILRRQIETLQKKAEQGSMQVQGEAAELLLEERLARAFPGDGFTPVGKGARGADVLQTVHGPGGARVGEILWESKVTQNWSPAWLAKLREDARAAGAELAVLVSTARPKEAETFALVEGIHVVAPAFAIPLAAVLRQTLVELAVARGAREGQQTKMEEMYAYLTGPKFRARVTAIVERFSEMQEDLAAERRAMTRLWARREKQLEAVLGATAGLHGDLQGIAGRGAIPEIAALDLAALPGPEAEE